nr:site-specific integrase [Parabacteroides goldsteinii]
MVIRQEKEKKKKHVCGDVLSYMDCLEKEKYSSGKKGTASLYKATRNQLEHFLDRRDFKMKRVNGHLVQKFVAHLQSLSLSQNSVSNYTSIFRAAYNAAVSENLVSPGENPFQKVYLRPIQTSKRSVGTNVIKEITYLNLKGKENLNFARDLFLFSFMACGIAFVDLAHLTRANIRGNVLVYYRVKTKTEIRVTITSGMRRLLDKYADAGSDLLFPVLKSPDASYESYKVALRTYNRRLAIIGKMLPSPVKLTSYVARHSWAMRAKENSVPVAVIGQALGHKSEKTTQFYLASLDQTIIDKANQKIINFVEQWISKKPSKD